ncbi:glycosyltransferase family 2 protein [Massilia sp. W12]|uniref:glycosyltransferase family 2 protein n=1 Tax=Massilia sp. W12 TaxID=3126507 RepID=UPI0030CDD526
MSQTWLVNLILWTVFIYFILLNLGYLMLNVLALWNLRHLSEDLVLDDLPQAYTGAELPISILVPAYNEETNLAAAVRSMLQLSYAEFEIIVINDGSRDNTLQVLQQEFELQPFPEAYRVQLPSAPVRAIYRSRRYPQLRVIDKENGGKADALNAGINAARYPLFCGVDADSLLERDSLRRVVKPFLLHPHVVAAGGTVRVANGCEVSGGFLTRVSLPRNFLALLQVLEYLRAFLFGRLGWSNMNAVLIISGAFGLFRKEAVIAVGGYRRNTIGEDMELVVRLHRRLPEMGRPYRICFEPYPVCWTEAPEDWGTLKNQRVRWQRGLAESLTYNWGLLRRPSAVGWLAFPFLLIFELFGPLIELFGYLFTLYAAWHGWISWSAFGIFIMTAILLGILLSLSGLLLEELSFHIYARPQELGKLLLAALLENLGYRQINSWWRIIGLWRWLTQRHGQWGEMRRKGHQQS